MKKYNCRVYLSKPANESKIVFKGSNLTFSGDGKEFIFDSYEKLSEKKMLKILEGTENIIKVECNEYNI